jgi:hypothetical protein
MGSRPDGYNVGERAGFTVERSTEKRDRRQIIGFGIILEKGFTSSMDITIYQTKSNIKQFLSEMEGDTVHSGVSHRLLVVIKADSSMYTFMNTPNSQE